MRNRRRLMMNGINKDEEFWIIKDGYVYTENFPSGLKLKRGGYQENYNNTGCMVVGTTSNASDVQTQNFPFPITKYKYLMMEMQGYSNGNKAGALLLHDGSDNAIWDFYFNYTYGQSNPANLNTNRKWFTLDLQNKTATIVLIIVETMTGATISAGDALPYWLR